MVKSKELLIENPVKVKKEKKKFNKNSSFSGVESNKSPKNRRKSIGTVLPTPLKKKNISNEWTVSKTGTKDTPRKGKLVATDLIANKYVEKSSSLLKTPKMKKKQSESAVSVSGKKKLIEKISSPAKQIVPKKEKKTVKEPNNVSTSNKTELKQKFGIEASNITKAVNTVIKLRRENPKLQNQLFDDPFEIFLQVCCHKVPRGPSRIIRIPLPNSLLTPDSEVCLIVPEVKGVKNIEHEKHIEHYENLLRTKGVENIKKIMTFHQFRTEHETFEQMLRLVDLYDAFLVDGRISGKVVKKCGKIFYKKRKVPTSVKLQATKLKEHIDKALSKAFFLLHLKGDSYSVQFGHDKMQTQDLVANVFAIIERLSNEFPGGFENIKGLQISTRRATSIPIYSSFKIPKEVVLPNVKSKKPKAYKTFKGELTTLLNADVVVKPTGQVIVKRTKMEEENVGNESKGKNQKTKKRKLSVNGAAEVTNSVEVENKENDEKIKQIKKRKHHENVSVETNVNPEGNPEVNSNENAIKKKKIKKVNSVKNVEKQKIPETDQTQNIKKRSIKKKTKVIVDIRNKDKKNKKKVKIHH